METTVKIPGMHCNACVTLITEISEESPNIHGVNINLESKEVTLNHDESLDLASWKKEIESLGADYKVFNQ